MERLIKPALTVARPSDTTYKEPVESDAELCINY
jgi:hypothetical protein